MDSLRLRRSGVVLGVVEALLPNQPNWKEGIMRDWQSQSHVKWYCKYHVVFVPKYRRRVIYGPLRRQIGGILRQLCAQAEIELVEGHAMPDHIHLCLSIPPKFSVANTVGFFEREIGDPDSPGVSGSAPEFHRAAFLGERVLREHRRPGRADDPSVHPGSGSRREAVGADAAEGSLGHFMALLAPSGGLHQTTPSGGGS